MNTKKCVHRLTSSPRVLSALRALVIAMALSALLGISTSAAVPRASANAQTIPVEQLPSEGASAAPSTGVWSPLGSGTTNTVSAIAIKGTDVFIGGSFTSAGGLVSGGITRYLAKWDGLTWAALSNQEGPSLGNVNSLAFSYNDLYFGGYFNYCPWIASNICKWNGNTYERLGSDPVEWRYGVNYTVRAIATIGSDVYVGGDFTKVYFPEFADMSYIALWRGSHWLPLGSGTNGVVRAIAISGNDVYIGGDFTQAGGIAANHIAKWDGSSWSPLGLGTNGSSVRAIAISGNNVYVGGKFTQAGGAAANRIAKWDGASWSPLGDGIKGANIWNDNCCTMVSAIATSGDNVYVGGDFTQSGGLAASNIAVWNVTSSTWSALGTGTNNPVQTIAIGSNDVYVGGSFDQAGGVNANYIAKYSPPTGNPVPTITSINPSSTTAGGSAFTLTVNGAGFVNGAKVRWGSYELPTTFVSSMQLTAAIGADDIATSGIKSCTVFNPAPGGGTSNAPAFYITPSGATTTSSNSASGANPSASTGGTTGVTATASGSGTVNVAIYNGNPGGTPSFGSSGAYVDVHAATGNSFTSLTVVDCSLNGGTQVYWWNGSVWALASNQTYDAATQCVTITVNASTSPSLSDLTGTPFGAGTGSSQINLFLPLIIR